ncbi:hypothetical protein [Ectobacillus ponti]|uniref:Uncharacterized protein n=1 Tax=Ectobacillus ponti TaxID=2961894 RepID=A0AA42BMM0_9BACI|nr:hypothetical protein [Ectobacillus ponti]MCP8966985.1 hypothetical protein [Ectobacillus ponti]
MIGRISICIECKAGAEALDGMGQREALPEENEGLRRLISCRIMVIET